MTKKILSLLATGLFLVAPLALAGDCPHAAKAAQKDEAAAKDDNFHFFLPHSLLMSRRIMPVLLIFNASGGLLQRTISVTVCLMAPIVGSCRHLYLQRI